MVGGWKSVWVSSSNKRNHYSDLHIALVQVPSKESIKQISIWIVSNLRQSRHKIFKIHFAVIKSKQANRREQELNGKSLVNQWKIDKVSYIDIDDSYLTLAVCLLAICQHD